MTYEDLNYHRERERHCRSMAELAKDGEVRRRHEELAELHASRASAANYNAVADLSGQLTA
jgi:hypothetical protein